MFSKIRNYIKVLGFYLPSIVIFGVLLMSYNAQAQSDLNLLPQYNNLFEFIQKGIVEGFLIPLSAVIAVLAIVWGGYQFYFGSFTGKQVGKQAVMNGVIGLAIISGYQIIVTLVQGTISNEDGISAEPLQQFIQETILNNFLLFLAGAVAVLAMVYGGYQYIASPLQKEQGLKTIQNAAIGLVIILLARPIQLLITGTIDADAEAGQNLNSQPILGALQEIVSKFLLPVSSVAALFFLVLGGFQWITAQGEERKIENAKSNLTNALIGLVVVILSFTITQLIIYLVTNFNLGTGNTAA
jgi:type IV secretory pathway VirB2 component (pilin)